jgi:hypothetical protein
LGVVLTFKPVATAPVEVVALAVALGVPLVVPDGCEEPQPAAKSSPTQATGIALAALIGTLTLT